MENQNHFALLVDDENDDPSALFERAGAARPAPAAKEFKKTPSPVAKLPTKPLPPAQAVKVAQGDNERGRGGRSGGRGNYGNRDSRFSEGDYSRQRREGGSEQNDHGSNSGRGRFSIANAPLNGDAPVGGNESGHNSDFGGGRGRGRVRGAGRGYGYMGDGEERPRQQDYDRRSGTGRGNDVKREGAGRGNWGIEIDPDNADPGREEDKPFSPEVTGKKTEDTQPEGKDTEKPAEVEEADKEMTLEEYEKVLSEKRKTLEALKAKERKVTADKDFATMQLIEKKSEEEVLLKIGSADKGKKKETVEKDERSKKPVSINEFLRPTEGEGFFSPSGRRGRGGRGRGERGGFRGGFGGGYGTREATAPSIEDPSHFPTLGGK